MADQELMTRGGGYPLAVLLSHDRRTAARAYILASGLT